MNSTLQPGEEKVRLAVEQDLINSDFDQSSFASRYANEPIPKFKIPDHGAPARTVYQMIKGMRFLDSTPSLNLASFVTTFMEDECEKLMLESLNVNQVDLSEYPSSTEIHKHCVAMIGALFNSPTSDNERERTGTATVGSSEAIMLGALALKKRWQERRNAKGLDTSKPNLVMGAEAHICWQKFCRYFDVEERYVYSEPGRYVATAELIKELIDENTIGVASILGSTYTGEFEDVEALDKMIGELNEKNGWDLGIHVDGASGAFVAPFLYPDLKWDFRLKNVVSINASGHKYGLVYPGVGWVIWRDAAHIPESIVFQENYLGTIEKSITLNFSKGVSQIIGQYYQLLRLGRLGYTRIMTNLDTIRKRLRLAIEKTGHFEVLSPEIGVPVVAFRLKTVVGDDGKEHNRLYDEYDIADRMAMKRWVIPAYTMPPNAEEIKLMRITIREDLTMEMVNWLVKDLDEAIQWLDIHHIFTQEQLENISARISRKTGATAMRHFDSSVLADPTKQIIRPC